MEAAAVAFLERFEKGLHESFDGTPYESQIPALSQFEMEGILAAYFVGESWCKCASTDGAESYYRKVGSGYHGWFHDPRKGGCGGITQTG